MKRAGPLRCAAQLVRPAGRTSAVLRVLPSYSTPSRTTMKSPSVGVPWSSTPGWRAPARPGLVVAERRCAAVRRRAEVELDARHGQRGSPKSPMRLPGAMPVTAAAPRSWPDRPEARAPLGPDPDARPAPRSRGSGLGQLGHPLAATRRRPASSSAARAPGRRRVAARSMASADAVGHRGRRSGRSPRTRRPGRRPADRRRLGAGARRSQGQQAHRAQPSTPRAIASLRTMASEGGAWTCCSSSPPPGCSSWPGRAAWARPR